MDIKKWQQTFKEKVLDNPKYKWYRRAVYGLSFAYAAYLGITSVPYYAAVGNAEACFKQGDYPRAEAYLKDALEQCRGFSADYQYDKRTVRVTNNLAELYRQEGRYQEAEPYYRQTITAAAKNFPENRPERAVVHNNLAALLREMGRYQEAEAEYNQALSIWQTKVKQPDSPQLAKFLCGMAKLKCDQGQYKEAENLYFQALKLNERVVGKGDVDNAYILANIGGLYRETKQYEKADRYYREALKLDLAVLGEEHPDTACDFNNLGANLREQNKLAEALPYFDKALKIRLAKLGRQHRLTAKTLMGQAELQRRLKHLDKAEILVRHALDIQSKSLPPGHPEIAEANDILGLILQDRDGGKSGAAVEAFQKALFIREKLLSPDHPDIKNSQEHLQNAMKLAQKPQ